MHSDDKISFDTFLKSEQCLPDSTKPTERVFEDSKPKGPDLSFLPLLLIAVLSIIGCALYYQNALAPVNNSFTVSGTDISSYLSEVSSQYKDGKININTANLETLCTLKSIGESKALEIISYRMANGSFKSISEIKNVKGIGDATFENIKDYICV